MLQLFVCLLIVTIAFALGHRLGHRQTGSFAKLPFRPGEVPFLTAKLVLWTAAIALALGLLASDRAGGANTYLAGWLTLAVAALALTARRLIRRPA